MAGIPIIESIWSRFIHSFTEFQMKTVMTFVIHEVCYWLAYIPFIVADQIPYCRRWKIQDNKTNHTPLQINCIKRLLFNHFLIVLPMIMGTHPVLDLMGTTYTVDTLPSLSKMIAQIALFFIIEDFVFYWGHRALHTPYLYNKVHSVHHEHAAPFGLAAEYAHPFEVCFLGTATLAGPMIIGPHLFTLYVYLILRSFQTVECHSGYDFPWSLNRWFPLYGGADFHDHHHRIHSGNYSSTFVWADALYQTDQAYRLWKQSQEQAHDMKKPL